MPDWAVTVVVAIVASLPGLASWFKVASDNRRAEEQAPAQQKQMLQAVADTASTTALQCMEAATKELHIQLDETREELNAERTARLAELDVLRGRLAEAERKLAEVQSLLASATKKVQALEAERVHWEMERNGLLRRIGELEGKV